MQRIIGIMRIMKSVLFFFLIGAVVFVPLALADTHGGGDVSLPDPLGGKDFITVLQQIVNFLILVAIPITALMIIYGAYQIMFAGGDTEKVTTGKRTILYTIVGFVIILLAWSIIKIIQNILGVSVI